MGYNSKLSGRITIHPPLTAKELRDNPDLAKWENGSVYVAISKQRENTDNGYTIVIEGREIIPSSEDSFKVYDLIDTLTKITATFSSHEYTGTIYVYGEESGDIWRVRGYGHEIRVEKPMLQWPDGELQEVGR